MEMKTKPETIVPDEVDILENDILNQFGCDVLKALLKDHTMSDGLPEGQQRNIFWATHDYEYLGAGYEYHSEINPDLITGNNSHVIMPRVLKEKSTQNARVRDMAEVFTPSWVCNAQNNLVDEAWFGRKDVFNKEVNETDGLHSWIATDGKIVFPESKSWQNYVAENVMEITCGEAPYIVSRYDATTADVISINNRIGLLDRKLRVVNENVDEQNAWLRAAKIAFMSTYGYEWQGDNLLLARESLLYTFIDYYKGKFNDIPKSNVLLSIAYIISWNIWQMDGLKCVVPGSCHEKISQDLFGNVTKEECDGCKTDNIRHHNGIYCILRSWNKNYERPGKGTKIRFVDLLPKR